MMAFPLAAVLLVSAGLAQTAPAPPDKPAHEMSMLVARISVYFLLGGAALWVVGKLLMYVSKRNIPGPGPGGK